MPSIYSVAPLQRQSSSSNNSVAPSQRTNQTDRVSSSDPAQNNLSEEGHYSGLTSNERTALRDQATVLADQIAAIRDERTMLVDQITARIDRVLERINNRYEAALADIRTTEANLIAIEGTSSNRVTITPTGREPSIRSSIYSCTTQVAPESSSETSTIIATENASNNHQITQGQVIQEAPYEIKAEIFSSDGQWRARRDSYDILWLGKVQDPPSSMQRIGWVANGKFIIFSPDSKWIAWHDLTHNLRLRKVESNPSSTPKIGKVAYDGPIAFSPNSQWIAWREQTKIVWSRLSAEGNEGRWEYPYGEREEFTLSDQHIMLPGYYYSAEHEQALRKHRQAWGEYEQELKKNGDEINKLTEQYNEIVLKYGKVTHALSMAGNANVFFLLIVTPSAITAALVTKKYEVLSALILDALSMTTYIALNKQQNELFEEKRRLSRKKEGILEKNREKIKKIEERRKSITEIRDEKKLIKIEAIPLSSGITKSEIRTEVNHQAALSIFSENKKTLLTIKDRHIIRIFNTETGEIIHRSEFSDSIIKAVFSKTGKWLAFACFSPRNFTYNNRDYHSYLYTVSLFSLETLKIESQFDLNLINESIIRSRSHLLSTCTIFNNSNLLNYLYDFGPLSFSQDEKWLIANEDDKEINFGFLYSIESKSSRKILDILSTYKTNNFFHWPPESNILWTADKNYNNLYKWKIVSEEDNLKLELI